MTSISVFGLSLLPPRTRKTLPSRLPPLQLRSPPARPLIHLRRRSSSSSSSSSINASYNPIPATDRLLSSAAYFLPFFNGLQYGRFLFSTYPVLSVAFQPLIPLLSLYRSVPFASFVAFFLLYLGVVRNPSFSRFVRFNSMQAVVLDVLLAIPLLLLRILSPPRHGLSLRLLVASYNAIFLLILASFLYSLFCCILGRTPYLPIVASAADRQL